MNIRTAFFTTLVLLALALAGCDASTADRGGGRNIGPNSGSDFDAVIDADYNAIVRNADGVPNFALICVDGYAYVARINTGSNGGATSVLPDPQRGPECAGDPR